MLSKPAPGPNSCPGILIRRQIWEAINDGTIYSCPSLLALFTVICFADLKKYKFTYLFGFPALHSEPSWKLRPSPVADVNYKSVDNDASQPLLQLTADETTALVDCVQTWRYSVDARQYGFFLAKKVRGPAYANEDLQIMEEAPLLSPGTPSVNIGFNWVIGSLQTFEEGFFKNVPEEDCYICFADPSTYPMYPGWMLRNLLVLVRKRWKLESTQILCYRDTQSRRHEARSVILRIEPDRAQQGDASTSQDRSEESLDFPRVTGWERSLAGKVASKVANLGDYMDPQRCRTIFFSLFTRLTLLLAWQTRLSTSI